tara:strand:- start:34 stop:360 length:327 start_codon:yes stop_codon:yes gene_type:complete
MGEQVVDELLANSEDKIGKVVLDYMKHNLCAECLEHKMWLTTKEAAFYLNISVRTLHNYCHSNKIKYQRIGKRSEFHIDWLRDFRLKNAKVQLTIEEIEKNEKQKKRK